MTAINHRRKNRLPVNARYARDAYVNGFAHPEIHHGPRVTLEFDELRQEPVWIHHGSRTGNTEYLDKSMHSWGRTSRLADRHFGANIGNDFTDGHRGMARAVRGAKKFVRTRLRFHENQATQALAHQAFDDVLP